MLVYCDPKTWPKDPEKLHLPEGWVVAVGVHPKHASDFGDYYFDRLSKLMDSPAVTALGEVGMDCSEGAKPFGIQKSTLRWVLAVLGSGIWYCFRYSYTTILCICGEKDEIRTS